MFTWITFSSFLMTILMFLGLFLIALILLQRGRGGGLASAFGGMSGHSFAGTKAGDVFTKITIGVATAWILLCAASVLALQHSATTLKKTEVEFKKEESKDGASSSVKKAKPLGDDASDIDAQNPLDLRDELPKPKPRDNGDEDINFPAPAVNEKPDTDVKTPDPKPVPNKEPVLDPAKPEADPVKPEEEQPKSDDADDQKKEELKSDATPETKSE